MVPTEIRVRPLHKRRAALIAVAALAAFYFIFGYFPVVLWIAGAVFVISLLISMFQSDNDARIVLNDEGVFDSRLKVGVIRWADIKRIQLYSLHGAEYISLELHNSRTYEAPRPIWLRILSNAHRVFGMSTIAISTAGLDMDTYGWNIGGLLFLRCT